MALRFRCCVISPMTDPVVKPFSLSLFNINSKTQSICNTSNLFDPKATAPITMVSEGEAWFLDDAIDDANYTGDIVDDGISWLSCIF